MIKKIYLSIPFHLLLFIHLHLFHLKIRIVGNNKLPGYISEITILSKVYPFEKADERNEESLKRSGECLFNKKALIFTFFHLFLPLAVWGCQAIW